MAARNRIARELNIYKFDLKERSYKLLAQSFLNCHLKRASYFDAQTSDNLCYCLEQLRIDRTRVKVTYSTEIVENVKVTIGFIGRATGKFKLPMCVFDLKTNYGHFLPSQSIITITDTNNGTVHYNRSHDEFGFYD